MFGERADNEKKYISIYKLNKLIDTYILMATCLCIEIVSWNLKKIVQYRLFLFVLIYLLAFYEAYLFLDLLTYIGEYISSLVNLMSYNELFLVYYNKIFNFMQNSFLGFTNFNDKVTMMLLSTVSKLTVTCLPISLTFYYFFYREQKATSESALIRNETRSSAILLMFSLAFSSIYASHLVYLFEDHIDVFPSELGRTIYYADKILIAVMFFSISIFLGQRVVTNLFRNINIEWLLHHSIRKTKTLINQITYISFAATGNIREALYNDLIYLIESIYQLLIYTVDKGLTKSYNQYFSQWSEVLDKLRLGKIFIWPGITVNLYLYLFQHDKECYHKLYSTILKNHYLLTVTLYNKHRMREGNLCLEKFLSLNPKSEKTQRRTYADDMLTIEFFSILYELALFLYKNNHIGLHPLIGEIDLMLKEKTEIEDVFIIYKSLLVKAVYENDVKSLTELTCAMYNSTKVSLPAFRPIASSQNPLIKAMLQALSENGKEQERKNIGLCLYVLLQALIKTIELSHYASTGYLIKYIVSNFESELLDSVYRELIRNGITKDKKLNSRKLSKIIKVSFKINDQTSIYCMQKLTLLLYAQQKFVREEKVYISKIPKNSIDTSILKCSYLDYLTEKITNTDKYGFLFLKREKFMNAVKNEICIIATVHDIWYG